MNRFGISEKRKPLEMVEKASRPHALRTNTNKFKGLGCRLPLSVMACICLFQEVFGVVRLVPQEWRENLSLTGANFGHCPVLSPRFSAKKHFRKTDCFDKERAREKTRFSVQEKAHKKKRHKTHVLNDRPVGVAEVEIALYSMPQPLHPVQVSFVQQ